LAGVADLAVCLPATVILIVVLVRYGVVQTRTEAENLRSQGMFVAFLLIAYSMTLFLLDRRLFGLLSRGGTIAAGIGLLLTALIGGVAALAMDIAVHL
jgi:hypothetical protein